MRIASVFALMTIRHGDTTVYSARHDHVSAAYEPCKYTHKPATHSCGKGRVKTGVVYQIYCSLLLLITTHVRYAANSSINLTVCFVTVNELDCALCYTFMLWKCNVNKTRQHEYEDQHHATFR